MHKQSVMKYILAFIIFVAITPVYGQDLVDNSKFPLIIVDTLHVYPNMNHTNITVNIPGRLIKTEINKPVYPVTSFFIDEQKIYKAYLLYLSDYNCIYLVVLDQKKGGLVYSNEIANHDFLESAYEKWQNAWVADFNNDGNLDIGIYNRLIDFELPTKESPNISADEKYLLIFKNGKLHRKRWNDNILNKFQLQPNQRKMKSKEITITGTALNAKLGAIIQTKSGEVYYLTGIYEWPDDLINKKIRVTGSISSEYYDKKDLKTKEGAYKTGMSGEKINIQNAKWEIAE